MKWKKWHLLRRPFAESERGIAEGTELLSGNKIKMDDTQDKNVIHPEVKVSIEEHIYNIR